MPRILLTTLVLALSSLAVTSVEAGCHGHACHFHFGFNDFYGQFGCSPREAFLLFQKHPQLVTQFPEAARFLQSQFGPFTPAAPAAVAPTPAAPAIAAPGPTPPLGGPAVAPATPPAAVVTPGPEVAAPPAAAPVDPAASGPALSAPPPGDGAEAPAPAVEPAPAPAT